jgi:hypothetical protein
MAMVDMVCVLLVGAGYCIWMPKAMAASDDRRYRAIRAPRATAFMISLLAANTPLLHVDAKRDGGE